MAFENGIATAEDIKIFNYLLEPEQVSDLVLFDIHIKIQTWLAHYNYAIGRGTFWGQSNNDFNVLNFPFLPLGLNDFAPAFLFERYPNSGVPFADLYSTKVYDFYRKYSFLYLANNLRNTRLGFATGETMRNFQETSLNSLYNKGNYIFNKLEVNLNNNNKLFSFSYYSPEYDPNYQAFAGFSPIEDQPTNHLYISNYRQKFCYQRIKNDCINVHYSRKWLKIIRSRSGLNNFYKLDLPDDILIGSLVITFDANWTQAEKDYVTNQIPPYYFYNYLDTFLTRIDNFLLSLCPYLLQPKTLATKRQATRENIEITYKNIYTPHPEQEKFVQGSETIFISTGTNTAISQSREVWRIEPTNNPAIANDYTFSVRSPSIYSEDGYQDFTGSVGGDFSDYVPLNFEINMAYLSFANNQGTSLGFSYTSQDLGRMPVFGVPAISILGSFPFSETVGDRKFVGLSFRGTPLVDNRQILNTSFDEIKLPPQGNYDFFPEAKNDLNSAGTGIAVNKLRNTLEIKKNRQNYRRKNAIFKNRKVRRDLLCANDFCRFNLNSNLIANGASLPNIKNEMFTATTESNSVIQFGNCYDRMLLATSNLKLGIAIESAYLKITDKEFSYQKRATPNRTNWISATAFTRKVELIISGAFSGVELTLDWQQLDMQGNANFVTNVNPFFSENILATHTILDEPIEPYQVFNDKIHTYYRTSQNPYTYAEIPLEKGYKDASYTGNQINRIGVAYTNYFINNDVIYPSGTYAPGGGPDLRYAYIGGNYSKQAPIAIDEQFQYSQTITETNTLRTTLGPALEVIDFEIVKNHIIIQHTECYETMACNCEEINLKLDKLIAALDANKFAFLDNSQTQSRVSNLGYYIERIARVLGISVNDNGSIRSIRQSKKIDSGNSLPSGWPIGQWGRNQGGNNEGQSGGLPTQDRDGLAYEIRSNNFDTDPNTGEPTQIVAGGYALVENLPQLLEIILDDLDRAIGWQDAGANAIPTADGRAVVTYQGINRMVLDLLYNQSSMSRNITGSHVLALKNQAILQEVLAAFGLPVAVKEIGLQINSDTLAPLPVPAIKEGSPTLNDLLHLILLNLSLLIGTKIAPTDEAFDEEGNIDLT